MSVKHVSQGSCLVSAIVPTHNRADLLPRAIRSVLEQSYQELECIVVDDASSDNTAQVVGSLDDDRIVYLRHNANQGASAARNTGIARAKGEFVAFLDDDDEWLPTKLEKQVPVLKAAPPEVGLVYCWMDYYDANGHLLKEHHPEHRGYVFPLVLDEQRIGGCPTLLLRRAVVEEVGGFDESLPRGNDGDFIRRVCLQHEVDLVPEVLVRVYTGHGNRISSSSEQGIRNAIRGEQVKLDRFKSHLEERPDIHATILRKLAQHWAILGERRRADQLLLEAARIDTREPYWLRKIYVALPLPIRFCVRRLWHGLVRLPERIRSRLVITRQRVLDRHRLNDLNRLYPEEWFSERKDGVWYGDVRRFCDAIWRHFEPRSVADVGCGPGVYLSYLRELGTERVLGLEGTKSALRQAAVSEIVWHDLRDPYHCSRQYDMVLCLEVAEHIHEAYSGTLVNTVVDLCRPGAHIVFAAAPPGQGGFHHINLQPREFWRDKFARRACEYREDLSVSLSAELDLELLHWLKNNVMIFRKPLSDV